MAQVTFTCPHCGAEKMTMTIGGAKVAPIEMLGSGDAPFASAFAPCGNCWAPVPINVKYPGMSNPGHHAHFKQALDTALSREHNLTSGKFTANVVFTPELQSDVPGHLTANVEKAFRSAERNYHSVDGEDAAAMLYRRALDIAIREKHPEVTGLLAVRIAELVRKGLLPPSMKEWADQIRLIGNDGAHEPDGVTKDELVPMRGFTEAFLRYFITIPFEVAIRRGEIDADGNPIAEPEI